MKRILYILLIPSLLVLITAQGCMMTPQAVIKEGINLNAYKYVYIHPVKATQGKPDKYGAAEMIGEIFKGEELQVLNEQELKQLSGNDLRKVLFCNTGYAYKQDERYSNMYTEVSVILRDSEGRELYKAKGTRDGINERKGVEYGIKTALAGFTQEYTKYDSSLTGRIAASKDGEKAETIKEDQDKKPDTAGSSYIELTGIPEQLSFPVSKGKNIILAAAVHGGFVKRVWLGKSSDAKLKISLTKTGKNVYQINLANPDVSAALEKSSGEKVIKVFAELDTGKILQSIGINYTCRLPKEGNPKP